MLSFSFANGLESVSFDVPENARYFSVLLPDGSDLLVLRNFACLDYTAGLKSAFDGSPLFASYLSSVVFDLPESFKQACAESFLRVYRISAAGIQESCSAPGDLSHGLMSEDDILRVIRGVGYAWVTCLPDYRVEVDKSSKRVRYFYKGVEIQDYRSLPPKDGFLLFCLLDRILHSPKHAGLFFVDASVLSEAVLKALLLVLGSAYGANAYVFFYNVSEELSEYVLKNLGIVPLRLPNHWSTAGLDKV